MARNAIKNYRKLRAGLIARGTNPKRWAEERGYPASTVYDAARGTRAGIKAVKILQEMEAFVYGP